MPSGAGTTTKSACRQTRAACETGAPRTTPPRERRNWPLPTGRGGGAQWPPKHAAGSPNPETMSRNRVGPAGRSPASECGSPGSWTPRRSRGRGGRASRAALTRDRVSAKGAIRGAYARSRNRSGRMRRPCPPSPLLFASPLTNGLKLRPRTTTDVRSKAPPKKRASDYPPVARC